MTPEQLEEVYTDLCYRLTALGEDRLSAGLARVVLVLLKEVGNADRIQSLVADALSDLSSEEHREGPWRTVTHQ